MVGGRGIVGLNLIRPKIVRSGSGAPFDQGDQRIQSVAGILFTAAGVSGVHRRRDAVRGIPSELR